MLHNHEVTFGHPCVLKHINLSLWIFKVGNKNQATLMNLAKGDSIK